MPDDVTASRFFFFFTPKIQNIRSSSPLCEIRTGEGSSLAAQISVDINTRLLISVSVLLLQTVAITLVGWRCVLRTFWDSEEQQNADLLPLRRVPLSNFKKTTNIYFIRSRKHGRARAHTHTHTHTHIYIYMCVCEGGARGSAVG